jgi:hypothetical protein
MAILEEEKLRNLVKHYPEVAFGGFTKVDGTIAFYSRVNAVIDVSSTVIDFGCGRGSSTEDKCSLRRELTSLSSPWRK